MPPGAGTFRLLAVLGAVASALGGPAFAQSPPPAEGQRELVLRIRDVAERALGGVDRTGRAIASWKVVEEQARRWPLLSGDARYSFESSQVISSSDQVLLGPGASVERYFTGLGLSYNLFRFLETEPRIKGALADERAATLRLTEAQSDAVQRATEAYLTVLAEREAVEGLERLRGEQRIALGELEAKLAQRAAPAIELVRLRSQMAATDRELLAAQRRLSSAELLLRKLCRVDPQERLALHFEAEDVDLAPIEALGVQGLLDRAKNRNARLLAAAAAAEAAEWQVKVAENARYPSLSLLGSAGYGGDRVSNDNTFRSDDFRYSVLLLFTVPLFDGGVRRAQIAQSQLTAKQRLDEARRAVDDVKAQLEDSYWTHLEKKRAWELLDREVMFVEDELRQVQARAGALGSLPGERLAVLEKLSQRQRQRAGARSDALAAGVHVMLAIATDPFISVRPPTGTGAAVAPGVAPVAAADTTVDPPATPERAAEPPLVEPMPVAPAAAAAQLTVTTPAQPPRGAEAAGQPPPEDGAPDPAAPVLVAVAPPAAVLPAPAVAAAIALRAIRITRTERSTTVSLIGDGPIRSYATFPLLGPPRFVIDLLALKDARDIAVRQLPGDARTLKRVRIGARDDGTRVVLDLSRADVGPPRVITRDGGLDLILDDGP